MRESPKTRLKIQRLGAVLVGELRGEGPSVLLLHAGGERRSVWRPVIDVLAANGYSCVAYDLRGHGDSGAGGAEHLPSHVQDVAAMITAQPYPVMVVGASLGGLASLLALANPDVIDKVAGSVLVDVVPRLIPARVRAFLNRGGRGGGDQPLVRDVLERRLPALAGSTQLLSSMPTMVVRAEASAIADEDCEWFAAQVPHASFATVAAAGHLVARDAPLALARLLLQQVASASVRSRRIRWLLTRCHVDGIAHPGGTLGDHLDRTADTLTAWEAPPWLIDAGRLHAAHGTDGFPTPVTGLTAAAIRGVAGPRTEHLVDLYGRCDRARTYPTLLTDRPRIVDRRTGEERRLTLEWTRAFAEMTTANELDVLAHSLSIRDQHGHQLMRLFSEWGPLLSPGARAACAGAAASRPRTEFKRCAT